MATLLPEGKQSFANSAGVPLVGGKVYTYDAGTVTPRTTYSDSAGTTPNTNPIILDARGEATIFWSGSYKVILKDAADVTIWSVDNVATAELVSALRAELAAAGGSSLVNFGVGVLGTQNYAWGGALIPVGNTGSNNIAFGASALSSLTNGTRNIAFGANALQNTTGGVSPAPGSQLGYGSGNIGIGVGALMANTSGYENTAIGDLNLISNTTGKWNLAVGHRSLIANTVGVNNIAVGPYVLSVATTAQYNIGVGFAVMEGTTGSENIGIGDVALNGVTTGYQNVCIGRNTMYAAGTGYRNVAIGQDVLKLNTDGHWNVSVGIYSMSVNTSGYSNAAFGYLALTANTTGYENVAIGQEALAANTTGIQNTAVGKSALAADSARVNVTALGFNAQPTANNQVVLGDSNVTSLKCAALNKTTWTPVDASGAELMLTLNSVPKYVRVGDMVHVFCDISYPATANGAGMLIGGLPIVAVVDGAGNVGYTDYVPATPIFVQLTSGAQGARIQTNGGTTLTNAQLSGKRVQLSATYFV